MANSPAINRTHFDSLVKELTIIIIAAGFFAAIQAKFTATTNSISQFNETIAFRTTVKIFFTGGLVLDFMAAMLGYLTVWRLKRLTEEEKVILEEDFTRRNKPEAGAIQPAQSTRQKSTLEHYYTWMGLSLFIPMTLLAGGIACLILGLYTHLWEQSRVVAALIGVLTIPFFVGHIFLAGNNPERRKQVIQRLGQMKGTWYI